MKGEVESMYDYEHEYTVTAEVLDTRAVDPRDASRVRAPERESDVWSDVLIHLLDINRFIHNFNNDAAAANF